MLLLVRADVALRDKYEQTALHYAVGHSVRCVELLVRARAEVDAVDKFGYTPLQTAVAQNARESAEYLLLVGAKLSKLGKDMHMPQWFADAVKKQENCRASVVALYGALRKRLHVQRDTVTIIAQMVWESRNNERWQHNHASSTTCVMQ